MKVLLTGGAGYIGSHTAIELLKENNEVIIADNFCNSKPEVINRIKKISAKNVKLYKIDVCNYKLMEKIFLENSIDSVIHFAGYKAVGESVEKPLAYYRNNIDSTLTLLELMNNYDVNNIVFSSSATVYGIPERVPLVETMDTYCTNPYGRTKLFIEQILTDACVQNKNLSAVLLRYFNPIGAHESGMIGEDPQGIPNNLLPYISQVAIGKLKKLNVFGNDYPTHDGTGVRDYIHVVDLAKGHVAAINFSKSKKGAEIFNLGTGKGYSVLDIIKTFEKVNNVKIPYRISKRRAGDIAECFADPTKAKNMLGWKAHKSLDDMCKDIWRWQQNNPKGYN